MELFLLCFIVGIGLALVFTFFTDDNDPYKYA